MRALVPAVALAAALALSACGGGPDPAACKAALKAQVEHAIEQGGPTPPAPKACDGLDSATMRKIVGEILYGN